MDGKDKLFRLIVEAGLEAVKNLRRRVKLYHQYKL